MKHSIVKINDFFIPEQDPINFYAVIGQTPSEGWEEEHT